MLVNKIYINPFKVLLLWIFMFTFPGMMGQTPIIEPPVIDSISVDTTDLGEYYCVLGWEPYDWTGYDQDSSGFIVRDVIPGVGYANPDTIYDTDATFYIDLSSDPFNDIQGYGLVAFSIVDGEFLKSEIADQFSRNIKLQVQGYDSCQAAVTLYWNDYYSEEAPSGVTEPEYKIIATSQTDNRIMTLAENIYTFSGLNRNESYTFLLKISTEDFSSTSNPAFYNITTPENPAIPKIEFLSTSSQFVNSGTIQIDQVYTKRLELMGSTDLDGPYDTIEIYSNPEQSLLDFSDGSFRKEVVFYFAKAYNACLINPAISDTLNTIVLSAEDNGSYIRLQANGVETKEPEYRLFRETNGDMTNFDPGEPPILFDDYSIFDLILENPEVSYYIEAKMGDTLTIRSNPVRVEIHDDLLWPNAIIAGEPGKDGAFKAIPQRSLPESFSLKIYNKWGELIFESNDVMLGWRGTFKGNFVMSGGYLFVAKYKFPGKKEKVVRGTVTVIH